MAAEMEVHQPFHLKGGKDESSYAESENLLLLKLIMQKAKPYVEESIKELMCSFSQLPNCINVAELGCSSSPNAFLSIHHIIESIGREISESTRPSVQVYLNDLVGNDFNNLFRSLPEFFESIDGEKLENGCRRSAKSSCFIAATPGSFYGRLFPDKSIHFVHSCYSLHYLSQVPAGLVSERGEPLNKKNITISKETSPQCVTAAYMDQFKNDFTVFLRLRSQEMAIPAHLSITFMCKNDEDDGCCLTEYLGAALYDMVKQGKIEEEKLATLNLPLHFASREEIQDAIESEGSFKLKRLEKFKLTWDAGNGINGRKWECGGEYVATYVRALTETILASHFGESVLDDLFSCFGQKVAGYLKIGKGIMNTLVISLAKE